MRTLFLSLLISFCGVSLFAQELTPVTWKMDIQHVNDDIYELSWRADIDKNWTVYSQFTSDDGPVPTEITYESEGFEKVGDAAESGHKKEGFDKLFEVDVIKFLDDQPFIIKQKVKAANGTKAITGYLTYMTCDASRCLPPTDVEFSFDIPSSSATKSSESTSTTENNSAAAKSSEKVTKVVEQAEKKVSSTKTNLTELPQKEEIKSASKNTSATASQTAKTAINQTAQKIEPEKTEESVLDLDESDFIVPVVWKFDMVDLGNDEFELKYIAEIDDKWNVYSQFTSDDGPIPTELVFEVQEGVELLGKATEEGHRKEGPDPLFDNVNVIKFLGDEDFILTQKIKASKSSKLKGYLTYMTCDASHCLPPTDVEFEVDFQNNKLGAPGIGNSNGGNIAGLNISGDQVDQRIPTIRESFKNPVKDCGGEENEDRGLGRSFILGFLGGLLALLTPCVFPMIPLTVSYFTKDTKRSGLANGIIYGISIIVIYVAMGLLLTGIFGEEALNALSTNWIANTLFFLIFLFFAFSFFGYYEITLPSSWTTKSDSIADKGGILGIFFMAFTLALVSFSCTGPIIGSAIVSAASNAVGPAVVMFGFALALALPFGFFAAFPSWLNSLPRSGGWMNSVKVILGFLELAFAFKFLSVADLTSHWNFLKYELFLGIWVIIAAMMALYLFGKIKFPHDSPVTKLSPIRLGLALGSVALTIYLATGFKVDSQNPSSYVPKAITSGIAPSANYNFFLPKPKLDKTIKDRYVSYTKCANDIPCFKDYYDGLNYAREVNKPVFIDFTGYGCVNCRKTEEFIWVDENVKSSLTDDYVLVSLYVDDRAKLKDQFVSLRKDPQGNNVKLRTVGNKWADFQIVNFEQNSQPLYVIMTNEEKVISNPRGYREGIEGYKGYLECGLDAISSLK